MMREFQDKIYQWEEKFKMRKQLMAKNQSLWVGLAMALTGCVPPLYVPTAETVPKMTVAEAREAFVQAAKSEQSIQSVRIKGGGSSVLLKRREASCVLDFHRSISDLKIAEKSMDFNVEHYVVSVYPWPCADSAADWYVWRFYRMDDARRFVDSLFILSRATAEELRQAETPGAKAAFAEVVRFYHSQKERPTLPEEARKYRVQAESALKEKRYADAADFYEQGLVITPWWAEGHFNRAVVLAEANNFEDAIFEMKRYLELEPKSADSRIAQDKIYEWESKTK
jgi:tetratricopeptide (TPR) repeat protein